MSKRKLSALALPLLYAAALNAQFTSNVQGTVTDPNNGSVPNAKVVLSNTRTGVSIESRTENSGFYRFTGIIPGSYRMTVNASGFGTSETGFDVSTDQTAGIDITLALASTSTQVVVTEKAAGVNTDETRLQLTLTSAEINDLPLQSRGILNIVKVAPGVTGIMENAENIPIGQNNPTARANGRPTSSNLYLVDGIPVTSSNGNGNLLITPNPDMIGEAALQTSTFSVENGAASSLQVDFTTKSGNNRMHGDADITYSGKSLAAVPYFASRNAPFTRKYLSGALGGPVVKNRTFFFGSFQTQRKASSSSGQGNYEAPQFTQWLAQNLPNSLGAQRLFVANPPKRLDVQKVVSYGRDAFSGNCGTPAALNIPCDLPIQVQGLFNQSPRLNGTQYNARLDHYFRNGKDRFFASMFRVDQTSDYLDVRPTFDSVTWDRTAPA